MGPKESRDQIDPGVAQIIGITRMCKVLNCLPGPGGLLDQDAAILTGMQIVLETDAVREQREMERQQRKSNGNRKS